jgi:hypothetical protein
MRIFDYWAILFFGQFFDFLSIGRLFSLGSLLMIAEVVQLFGTTLSLGCFD